MPIKTFDAQFKTLDSADDPGTYEAIVSVFGNVDSQGDRVVPGAFKDDLERWRKSGNPIPVIWSHDWRNPYSLIGTTLDAKETDKGLYTRNRLDIDSNDQARQVHRLMLDRRINQFSFAYEVVEGEWVKEEGKDEDTDDPWDLGVYELRGLRIFEHGPCLVGANQETELLDAKGQGARPRLWMIRAELATYKQGRVLSAANEARIRDIQTEAEDIADAAGQILGTLEAPKGRGKAEPPASTDATTDPPPIEPLPDNPERPDQADQDLDHALEGLAALSELRDLYAAWETT